MLNLVSIPYKGKVVTKVNATEGNFTVSIPYKGKVDFNIYNIKKQNKKESSFNSL